MPAELAVVGFCPQYFSAWTVPGSKEGVTYDVLFNGAESMPYCACPAFKYSKDGDCKHIRRVFEHGCLWNPQWKDAGPNDYEELGIKLGATDTMSVIPGTACIGCKQPMVAVRIAV